LKAIYYILPISKPNNFSIFSNAIFIVMWHKIIQMRLRKRNWLQIKNIQQIIAKK